MRYIIGLGILLIATATKATSSILDKINWSWQSIQGNDIRILKEEISLRLLLLNRSEVSIPLKGFTGTISRDGLQIAKIQSSSLINLPPNEKKLLQLNVKVDTDQLLLQIGDQVENTPSLADLARLLLSDFLEVRGSMNLNGLKVPFYEKIPVIK